MTPVIAVVGPTAMGKTALGVALAMHLNTEIISADSMQVYRGMEIGTGAPSAEEQSAVRHHFVGILEPGERYSAGAFGDAAREVLENLQQQGKSVVIAGGSGLYVRALIDGLFPGPSSHPEIRTRLEQEAESKGVLTLYERLVAVDPDYAAQILPGDLRRIVRALEVYEITGELLSHLHAAHKRQTKPINACFVALEYLREALYSRINARVDSMLDAGFEEEVKSLLDAGHRDWLMELRALGYREFIDYFEGRSTYEQAVELMKRNTRRFARRQLIWFRADKRIHWLPATLDTPPESHTKTVLTLIQERETQ